MNEIKSRRYKINVFNNTLSDGYYSDSDYLDTAIQLAARLMEIHKMSKFIIVDTATNSTISEIEIATLAKNMVRLMEKEINRLTPLFSSTLVP